MRVARYCGFRTVEEARSHLSPLWFLRWRLMIQLEEEDAAERSLKFKSGADWQAAKVSHQIYELVRFLHSRLWFGKKNEFKALPDIELKDFLVQFKTAEEAEEEREVQEELAKRPVGPAKFTADKERVKRSAANWAAWLGVPLEKVLGESPDEPRPSGAGAAD